MKIVVCFKTITDFHTISQKDWEVKNDFSLDLTYGKQIFNCYDESSLEIALKLADHGKDLQEEVELTALTVDDKRSELFLRILCSLNYDNVIRINNENTDNLAFNPLVTSQIIASYIKNIGHQHLVLLGAQSGEGDNGQTGLLVAEHLGWPCINDVIDTVFDTDTSVTVTTITNGMTIIQTVTLPIVLVISNSPESPYLRVPTLKQKLESSKKEIPLLSIESLGIDKNKLLSNDKSLIYLNRPITENNCTFIDGSDAKQKSRILYDRYLKGKLNI